MTAILTILLPFFGLILIGYGVGRFKLIPAEGLAGLDFFVTYLALPVLFFQLIAATPLSSFAGWGFVATTTFATYCAFAIAFSIGALINGGNVPEATVEGLIGSWGNTALLAPALTIAAFGAAAAVPTALVFSFDTVMLLIVTPLMMALGGTARTGARKLAEAIGWRIVVHPIIVATMLGFIAAAVGFKPPVGIDALLTGLRQAAVPAALFAFGVNLSQRAFGGMSVELPFAVAVKLVVHPAIVYLLLGWIGGYDPVWVATAVLVAALPPAANVVSQARRYGVFADRAATGLLLGSVAAVVTVTVAVVLLVNGTLPVDPFH